MDYVGQILLANGDKTQFLTGDTITGTIDIQSNDCFFVQEISISFEGLTHVRFEDLDKKVKHGQIVYFMQYFESNEYLVQQNLRLHNNAILQKGQNEFKFSFFIPRYLPSTLSATSGFVQYELVLALNYAKTNLILCRKIISVQRYDDIWCNPELLLPYTVYFTKNCYWWSCKAMPIYVSASLSSRAFIPGDIIQYTLRMQNQTRRFDIKRISTFIIQTIQYKSLQPKIKIKTEYKTMNFSTHLQPCARQSKNKIINTFKLPDDLVTSSPNNSLLIVDYKFQVVIVIKGVLSDGFLIIPITIGSHRGTFENKTVDFDDNPENQVHQAIEPSHVILSIDDGDDVSRTEVPEGYAETIV